MHHHKQWFQVQSNSHVHEAPLRDKVLQPQVKLHHFRRLNSSLREYLFIEQIAYLAVQCIEQLLLSCLRHAMQIGQSLLCISLEYLSQHPSLMEYGCAEYMIFIRVSRSFAFSAGWSLPQITSVHSA